MTIKELAEFTGKNKTTVQRWIAKCKSSITDKMQNASKDKASDYTIDEVEEILNHSSMSKDAVKILMNNARQETAVIATNNTSTQNVEVISMFKMMFEQNQQFMSSIMDRMDKLEGKKPNQLLLPEAPEINPRALLRQLVNDYAHSINITHQESWNELYKQFYYRCNESIKVKAKNLNIIPLDYLENENKLLTACSIMKDLIG